MKKLNYLTIGAFLLCSTTVTLAEALWIDGGEDPSTSEGNWGWSQLWKIGNKGTAGVPDENDAWSDAGRIPTASDTVKLDRTDIYLYDADGNAASYEIAGFSLYNSTLTISDGSKLTVGDFKSAGVNAVVNVDGKDLNGNVSELVFKNRATAISGRTTVNFSNGAKLTGAVNFTAVKEGWVGAIFNFNSGSTWQIDNTYGELMYVTNNTTYSAQQDKSNGTQVNVTDSYLNTKNTAGTYKGIINVSFAGGNYNQHYVKLDGSYINSDMAVDSNDFVADNGASINLSASASSKNSVSHFDITNGSVAKVGAIRIGVGGSFNMHEVESGEFKVSVDSSTVYGNSLYMGLSSLENSTIKNSFEIKGSGSLVTLKLIEGGIAYLAGTTANSGTIDFSIDGSNNTLKVKDNITYGKSGDLGGNVNFTVSGTNNSIEATNLYFNSGNGKFEATGSGHKIKYSDFLYVCATTGEDNFNLLGSDITVEGNRLNIGSNSATTAKNTLKISSSDSTKRNLFDLSKNADNVSISLHLSNNQSSSSVSKLEIGDYSDVKLLADDATGSKINMVGSGTILSGTSILEMNGKDSIFSALAADIGTNAKINGGDIKINVYGSGNTLQIKNDLNMLSYMGSGNVSGGSITLDVNGAGNIVKVGRNLSLANETVAFGGVYTAKFKGTEDAYTQLMANKINVRGTSVESTAQMNLSFDGYVNYTGNYTSTGKGSIDVGITDGARDSNQKFTIQGKGNIISIADLNVGSATAISGKAQMEVIGSTHQIDMVNFTLNGTETAGGSLMMKADSKGFSTLEVTGTLTMNGCLILDFTDASIDGGSDIFNIFATTNKSDSLADLDGKGMLSVVKKNEGDSYSVLYNFDDATQKYLYQIAYTAIPEPSTYAGIFGLLALGFAFYRRKK